MRNVRPIVGCVCGLLVAALQAGAQSVVAKPEAELVTGALPDSGAPERGAQAAQPQNPKTSRSPWLAAPLLSSGPKMGTAVGGLGAYLYYFDPESDVSIFGAAYEYSNTDSQFGALFARTSFGADHHRIVGVVGLGLIKNEYTDYQGTGQPLQTTDDLRFVAARYLYRVKGDWFAGAQGMFAKYNVSGATENDDIVLGLIGVNGFNSGGVGLSLMHDSRTNPDMPESGWYSNAYNLANSRWLGAEEDYDIYRLDVRWFLGHGKGHVLAVRQNNQFTVGAPTSAESTVYLRGYKIAQYLGRYMSSIEVEERLRFSRRWGATLFTGVAWLYGGSSGPVSSNAAYPTFGGGLHFILRPEDHMLVALEYAYGNSDNQGLYLRLGYAW